MRPDVVPLEAAIDVFASPEHVWSLVSDPRRIASWSPQAWRTFVRGGHRGSGAPVGTRTLNINRRGILVWPTRAKVVESEAPVRFAFRIAENHAVWSFTLEPIEGGTRVVHRRELPTGTSDLSDRLVDLALGGQQDFQAELTVGMNRTLRRLKADAERRS